MVRTIALVGLVAALTAPQTVLAGSSGYGTEGPYGRHSHARSTFDRNWNQNHESKNRAEASARGMRRHGKGFPTPF